VIVGLGVGEYVGGVCFVFDLVVVFVFVFGFVCGWVGCGGFVNEIGVVWG